MASRKPSQPANEAPQEAPEVAEEPANEAPQEAPEVAEEPAPDTSHDYAATAKATVQVSNGVRYDY